MKVSFVFTLIASIAICISLIFTCGNLDDYYKVYTLPATQSPTPTPSPEVLYPSNESWTETGVIEDGANITTTFSKSMDQAAVENTDNYTINYTAGSTGVSITGISYDTATYIATFTIAYSGTDGTETYNITPAASITSNDGYALTPTASPSYNAVDRICPGNDSWTESGTIYPGENIFTTFSEPMDQSTVENTANYTIASSSVIITHVTYYSDTYKAGFTIEYYGTNGTESFTILPTDSIIDLAGNSLVPTGSNAYTATINCGSSCPTIIWVDVPAGTFKMGDEWGDGNVDEWLDSTLPWDENTNSTHTVTLTSFQMMAYEVSNEDYDSCYNSGLGPCTEDDNDGTSFEVSNFPVVGVTWQQAFDFCTWIGGTLPTEAQWEYAASWGNSAEHGHWKWSLDEGPGAGDNFDCSNYCTSICGSIGNSCAIDRGSLPNYLGLYDMSGNVWEWCRDWYQEDFYKSTDGATNPYCSNNTGYKTRKGCGWGAIDPVEYPISYRSSRDPSSTSDGIGFRCVRSIY